MHVRDEMRMTIVLYMHTSCCLNDSCHKKAQVHTYIAGVEELYHHHDWVGDALVTRRRRVSDSSKILHHHPHPAKKKNNYCAAVVTGEVLLLNRRRLLYSSVDRVPVGCTKLY